MKIDVEKMRAAGFSVELVDGGAMVATRQMTRPQFVPMVGDDLQLVLTRSSLHRAINDALGGTNPKIPGDGAF